MGHAVAWLVQALCYNLLVRFLMRSLDCFNSRNPSSCTTIFGLTQPQTEMSTRNRPGGKKLPARKADYLAAICEPSV
jgi:hypothetical protein